MKNLIDLHLHLSPNGIQSTLANVQGIIDILESCDLRAVCIQNIVQCEIRNILRNPLALLAKHKKPENIFSFGGIRFPEPNGKNDFNYLQQVQQLNRLGFDGLKLFGKPTEREAFGEPFDSPVFFEMFDWLEKTQFPILFHVGDPKEFWSMNTAPKFAIENGFIYNKVPFDAYYNEIDSLMTQHPNLNILFPHFFFLSDDLQKLSIFLNKWPSVFIDITPGSEMYIEFSKNSEKARDFFISFQDRIIFGTDNTGYSSYKTNCVEKANERIDKITKFLYSSSVDGWGARLNGLHLPDSVVNNIVYKNFYRFIGNVCPKHVNIDEMRVYIDYMKKVAEKNKLFDIKLELELILDEIGD